MENIYKTIKKDKQIWKFCFYGLLKNLKFFEPYLLIYLLGMGMSFLKIGILYSIREIVTYIFEIPSGIFADNYGKKKELMTCFVFYIISFIFFFIGTNMYFLIIAMIFFGLGEAFRSGTHKAMIYSYLEEKNWFKHKAFVYGRTRSFSLIGSSISAFISIILILNLPSTRWIFLICIVPYILDFLLIWSYPDALDEIRESELSIKKFFETSVLHIRSIASNKPLRKLLVSSSLYDGVFKTIKDYIQPVLKTTIIAATITGLQGVTTDAKVKIYLGIIYGVFYIFSSLASKNVYRLNNIFDSGKWMSIFFDIMAALSLILFISIKSKSTMTIIITFFILYVLKDARRPLFVDVCGDYMNKTERATVMSVDSQLRALFTVVFAPIFGFIADNYSLETLFLIIGVFIIVINRFIYISKDKLEKI